MLMYLLTRLVAPIFCVFAMLNIAAHTVGSAQPPNPVLAGFTEECEGKPQPCWNGITPGVTSITDARQIMSQYSKAHEIRPETFMMAYQLSSADQVFFDSLYNINVDHMILKMDKHVSVGEVLSAVGMPNHILFRYTQSPITYTYDYKKGQMYLILMETPFDRLSPHEDASMLVDITSTILPALGSAYQWHGFAPFWKYCQIEPNLPTC